MKNFDFWFTGRYRFCWEQKDNDKYNEEEHNGIGLV